MPGPKAIQYFNRTRATEQQRRQRDGCLAIHMLFLDVQHQDLGIIYTYQATAVLRCVEQNQLIL